MGKDRSFATLPLGTMSYIVARHIRTLSDKLRPFGLTTPMWRVLNALSERDGRNIGELAEHAALERSYMSRIVDRMEQEKLVRRKEAEIDKRYASVCLSGKGRRLYLETKPIAAVAHDLAADGLTSEEFETLSRLLDKVLENVHRRS